MMQPVFVAFMIVLYGGIAFVLWKLPFLAALSFGVSVYAVGFILTLFWNGALGNVMLNLALLRSALWPIYWVSGWPYGQFMPMD